MRTRPSQQKPFLTGLLTAMIALGLSGCAGPAEEDWYAIANGTDADVGGVEVRSLLIVSSGENRPGRLLGMLFNTTERPVDVTLSDEDDSVTVRLEAQADYGFDTNPAVFSSIPEIPGSRVPVTVSVESANEELSTPVFDGTLQAYRPYLPTATPSP